MFMLITVALAADPVEDLDPPPPLPPVDHTPREEHTGMIAVRTGEWALVASAVTVLPAIIQPSTDTWVRSLS